MASTSGPMAVPSSATVDQSMSRANYTRETTVILGCDVSHWQGSPDFAAVRASGRGFVVLKATEGADYVDPQFTANLPRARAAGLAVGYYHKTRAGDPAAEAAWFAQTVGDLGEG